MEELIAASEELTRRLNETALSTQTLGVRRC